MYEKPTSQSYCEKLLETKNLNWKEIYILPRKVSIDSNLFMFQHKLLHNILHNFSFSISYFSSLKRFHHHYVLFATLQMKLRCISSILVLLQSNYGTNFNVVFLSIFIFLKSFHRVPSSDSLISAINNRVFN